VFGFRSRAKKSEIVAVAAPAVAHEIRQTSFRVGDYVRTIGELDGLPAGCLGEVTEIEGDEGKRSYRVMPEKYWLEIRATAEDLRLIAPYDPTILSVGTRVRLTQDFTGFLWEENIAWERQDVKGDPVSYVAGTTGIIVAQRPAGADEYLVSPDYQGRMSLALAVRVSKLERIRGRTRVITDSDGGTHIQQLFSYMDVVRLRNDLTGEAGSVYKAGWVGYVRPINPAMSMLQSMEESWRTGIYTVHISDHPSSGGKGKKGIFDVRTSALKLDSDSYPSPYSSIPRKDKAAEADPESVVSDRPSFDEKRQGAADGVPSAVDTSEARDMWAFVVAVGEDDEEAADAILARGDHVQMLAWATSHIIAKLREEDMDPVAYGQAIVDITEKEANDGVPGAVDTSGARRLWAFVVAVGEDDEEAADAILARGDHVQMLAWATSHIMVLLRQKGTDPVAYGQAIVDITEKEAKGEL